MQQQKFPYFYQELAEAVEYCLSDDLDPDQPYEDFQKRVHSAFSESETLLNTLLEYYN